MTKWSATMKSIVCASVFALSLLGFAAPRTATAQSAAGSLKFSLEDDLTRAVEFKAVAEGEGAASGEMVFSGPVEIPDQDVDGTGEVLFSGKLEDLQINAKFDGLVVVGNRAVMSGTVTSSNVGDYVGQRVLLAVADGYVKEVPKDEDPPEGEEKPEGEEQPVEEAKPQDTLTWGLYKEVKRDWIPTDAELEYDEGARLTWWATDAEREDDKGIPSHPSRDITAQTFPLSSHDFELKYSEGEIIVQP